MKKLKALISDKYFILFVLVHIVLFNINSAEWGDSYRILRASEYIRDFSYPTDEKRQPLYSIFLAIRPEFIDQVVWGRVLMFGVSIAAYIFFVKILDQYKINEQAKKISYLLFTFNPVFLYWSIRLMADVFFALIVLITLYLYKNYKDNNYKKGMLVIGFLLALAVLTRFEGYILGFSIFLDILLQKNGTKEKILNLLKIGLSFLLVSMPWMIYRNPLTSSYFEEPGGREYNLNTVLIYVASLLFIFGFSHAFYFYFKGFNKIKEILCKNIFLATFIIIELILALVWPAAIPRLFVPIIPFLIMFLALSIDLHFSTRSKEKDLIFVPSILLLGVYVISQYFFKLQFLVLIKNLFILIVLLQLPLIYTTYKRNIRQFAFFLILSMFIWSFSTIYIHKDIFKPVKKAAVYASDNLSGKVAYNDVSSVSDWYLNQAKLNEVAGVYLNMDSKSGRSSELLREKEIDYILITNEHNPTLEFDETDRSDLELLQEFRYTTNGGEFFTKVLKVKK